MVTAPPHTERSLALPPGADVPAPQVADAGLRRSIDGILARRPAIGLAVGVARTSGEAFLDGRGLADLATRTPVTEDTVFRIGSITKLFTAIAVLQLVEEGRVDLDAPAGHFLRAYRLVPAKVGFRPPTVRHLLTHTSGIPEVVHLSDLLHPGWGPLGARPAELSVPVGGRLPSLGTYYRGALRVAVEPGTVFQYSNHGYATLGQLVEDVTGVARERYFRERLFEPLGMTDTDLVRSERLAARLATGYAFGRRGPRAVPDREWICRLGAGGIYSTARDMTRFMTALLGGGANEHGRVLERATLATMFEAHYRPDPRLPGRGLGFVRGDAAGHLIVGHDGLLPGFDASLMVAPDDGIGIVAVTNGSSGAHTWLGSELDRLLRVLIGVPTARMAADVPHHPEIWPDLCGRYRLPPGSDLRGRLAMGAGAEVFVRGGRLYGRVLTPVPDLYRGLPLHPSDRDDPDLFELDLSAAGMPPVRVAFSRVAGLGVRAVHVDLPGQPLTFIKEAPSTGRDRGRSAAVIGATAVAAAVTAVGRRRRARPVRRP